MTAIFQAAIRDGETISPHAILRTWGSVLQRSGNILPENFGWPGATIEARLREFGHGAKEPGRNPELTAPERAVEDLSTSRAIAAWADPIIRSCSYQQRLVARLVYVRELTWDEAAQRMTDAEEGVAVDKDEIEGMLRALKDRLRRAIAACQPGLASESYA